MLFYINEVTVGAKWTEGMQGIEFRSCPDCRIQADIDNKLTIETSSNWNHSLKWLCIFFPSLFIMSNMVQSFV
ncbi:hypothetical protein T07_5057 [Trichinella nelsoni]|uniref:Uncharacterized protein n=1 Tax=Trichinella nelsoni TaxID=6336 RepID=A0A0V0SBK6_9BILA|nr:hypothetical protein T07_5057 [Trichinella nelsoni]